MVGPLAPTKRMEKLFSNPDFGESKRPLPIGKNPSVEVGGAKPPTSIHGFPGGKGPFGPKNRALRENFSMSGVAARGPPFCCGWEPPGTAAGDRTPVGTAGRVWVRPILPGGLPKQTIASGSHPETRRFPRGGPATGARPPEALLLQGRAQPEPRHPPPGAQAVHRRASAQGLPQKSARRPGKKAADAGRVAARSTHLLSTLRYSGPDPRTPKRLP